MTTLGNSAERPRIRIIYPVAGFSVGEEMIADEVTPVGDYLSAPVQYRVGEAFVQQRYVEVIG